VAPSPDQSDYWAILGLEPGGDAAALKRAFRAQARRWHPDLNGNDPVAEERFKLVNEAYAVLSDPRRRQAWESGAMMGPDASAAALDPFASGFPAFEDYCDALFGTGPRPGPGPGSGSNSGSGSGPGQRGDSYDPGEPSVDSASARPASVAEAAGSMGVTHAPPPPPPVTAASDAETLVYLTPEQALSGARVELELPDGTCVEVWTPPLAGDGWRLRLAGLAPGGGDHFLHLQVRTPEGLRIDGLRVDYQLELLPADAVLGCSAVVPTLAGAVKLQVPPASSSGRLLRLRGRGMQWGDRRGDQLVEVRIVVPEQLDDDERALYRRLRELAEDEERRP
jgi:DnaJ-class molecular chaperone